MERLFQAVRSAGNTGDPLPTVFPSLTEQGWVFRRGQVVMIASAPNVGKSLLALYLAVHLDLPTLYLSADTDQFTMFIREAAMRTGETAKAVEQGVRAGASGYYEDVLRGNKNLWFDFTPAPTLSEIDLEVSAFDEVYGEPPAVIVLDNVINVQCEDGDEYRGLRVVTAALHELARSTGACVLALHHVTGEFEDGQVPPPRRALHGKISKYPESIYTLGRQGSMFGIACVKNRSGPADPLASDPIWLMADFDRMRFTDPLTREI